MNGTVAPSARSLAVAATWMSRMPSSLAILAVKSRAGEGVVGVEVGDDVMVCDVIVW